MTALPLDLTLTHVQGQKGYIVTAVRPFTSVCALCHGDSPRTLTTLFADND